jgi:predicted negative regulator of RcsB-dependent stress response
VKLGPSIPSGYYSWGVALAKHGDLNGAVAKLKTANEKGLHWADPLKARGDVLAKQGKTKEALVKYEEALKYAPLRHASPPLEPVVGVQINRCV